MLSFVPRMLEFGFWQWRGTVPTVTDSIEMQTDRETLWNILTDPDKILQWFEGLATCEPTADYPGVGSKINATYKVAGVSFDVTNTVMNVTPGEEIHYQMDGLITGTQDWVVSDSANGLRLDFQSDYKMSGGVLGKVAEPVVQQMNVTNTKKSMAKIKQLAEG